MSTNEELAHPPKPRVSPLEFRNTDLVSRLLAATPPYLYNMPIVPNSYFFSEMLRSLVQAKAEASHRMSANPVMQPTKRTRKRSWAQARGEYYQKMQAKAEKQETNWTSKGSEFENQSERPLELTTAKIPSTDISQTYIPESMDKPEMPMFPNVPTGMNQDSNLLLPPPPPIWYPPLYPTPYGIDPLHFLIDLRVSGHIYDRKNHKESATPPQSTSTSHNSEQNLEEASSFPTIRSVNEGFKQSKHASAFRVPLPNSLKNVPMNLSHSKESRSPEQKNTKFDVKSLGFDKNPGKTTTNYVMSNINNIYKSLHDNGGKNEVINVDDSGAPQEEAVQEGGAAETEEEKQKKVKDLRALIGLELVVDYMSHAKPQQGKSGGCFGDTESGVNNGECELILPPENRETQAY